MQSNYIVGMHLWGHMHWLQCALLLHYCFAKNFMANF